MKAIFITTEEIKSNNTSLYFKIRVGSFQSTYEQRLWSINTEWVGGGMENP